MKFLTRKKSMTRKILIILLVALILIFAVTPNYYNVQAVEEITEEDIPDEGEGILGSLLKQIIQIFAAIGDIAMGTLNHFMLGADGFTSAMLAPSNDNIGNPDSWLYVGDDEEIDYEFGEGTINTAEFFSWILGDQYDIPNFLYSPENIFANNIAALDVNFLNPNDFEAVSSTSDAEQASQSSAGGVLRQTISDWYISFRNIAIVGLLSVLVYLGIRILISSTATDKAKYKESLQSWVVALCLVFFIHFIMSGLLMITDKFTDLVSSSIDDGITVHVAEDNIKFRTNIIGLVRFNAQSQSMYNTAAYTILYLVLVIYTFIFTFMYFKRFLYMAFFTMIAPLVALTYPVDKAGDGKAQAFNLWFKEYTMNLVLQPVHLILYIALVSSAMELVKQNMIYAIVAIGFLIPAEKFIKKMFGMDKAETPSGFGSFAAGAATMSGFKQVASMLTGGKNKNGSNNGNGGNSTDVDKNANRVRTQDRDFLGSFRNGQNGLPVGDDNNTDRDNSNSNARQQLSQQDDMEAESPEHQRMLDDRDAWQSIIDDPNTSDMDREEAQQQIDLINGDMRDRGYNTGLEVREDNNVQEMQGDNETEGTTDGSDINLPNQGNYNNTSSWEALQEARRQQQRNYMRKRAIRGVKKAGKIALRGGKIAAQGLGIAAGATAGLIAGTATGDFSNTMAYMGAGAVAGSALGRTAGNLPERAYEFGKSTRDTAQDKLEDYRYNRDKDMYGVGVAAERAAIRQNEKIEKQFLDDKSEQAKYEEMAGRIKTQTGKDVKTEDLMKAAFDYKKAGITDEKQIETGLTMETKHDGRVNGNNHDKIMDVVHMANNYGKDYVLDDKKRNSLQGVIKDNIKNERSQDEVWDLYTEALGMNKDTARRYAINPPAQQSSTRQTGQTSQTGQTNQTRQNTQRRLRQQRQNPEQNPTQPNSQQ